MEIGDGIGAIATFVATLGAFKISRYWRTQKGSDVLSSISKEIYMDLDDFQDLITETIDLTFFQFLNHTASSDPLKNYNNKYQYKIDDLKEAYERICRKFEIITKYKSKDIELNNKINLLKSYYNSIYNLIKEMDTVIGTTEMVKEYDKERVENIKKTIAETLKDYKEFIDKELKKHLIDYIFCIK